MYLIPKSEIEIGKIKFYGENAGINSVEIDMSVKNLTQSAKIVMPLNFKEKDGKKITDLVHTGDKVLIRLGYNDNIEEEFRGYVKKIGAAAPLEIGCDDEWYPFKRAEQINKSWKSTTLKEILTYLFKGWNIEAVEVNLPTGFVIKNATPFEAIKGLKESYGFLAKIDEKSKTIKCFWAYDFKGFNKHTYVLGTRKEESLQKLHQRELSPNVVKNDLKFNKKEYIKLHITGKCKTKAGKQITFEYGSKDDDAVKRTCNFLSTVDNEEDLKERTIQEYNNRSFDGYEGKITGFGVPRVKAGDTIKMVDVDNEEREGEYLVESVKVKCGVSGGFRRECALSYKI
ncbi:MAG: hypothetical protein ACTTJH_00665 [Bacteroidales bacterium]